ncbi:MAG: hypothetical protein P1V51_01935 [Deltaproteobacteria bacterium]|nr:hypothetical protein [Deltaproteobacteria bacterium]
MPSSTSSSRQRVPPLPAFRLWGLTALLALSILGGAEAAWRSVGHLPTVTDDPALWAVERSRVYGEKVVVLLGASRIQLGLDPSEMERLLPDHTVLQLAIDGSAPFATLRDLAEDPDFRGTVLVSVVPGGLRADRIESQQAWVKAYHDQKSPDAFLNRRLASLAQERLTVLSPSLNLRRILLSLLAGEGVPAPFYLRTLANRTREGDYRMIDLARYRMGRIARVQQVYAQRGRVPFEAWRVAARTVAPWVKAIQERGGRVVFLRFPTQDQHWVLDQAYYPRAIYWDALAAETGAETLHLSDVPALQRYRLPDTSHLDYRDKREFTRELVEALQQGGLLAGGAEE